MAILPENMNKLDVNDTRESLATIESYIRYMAERIEFGFSTMAKKTTDFEARLRKLENTNAEASATALSSSEESTE